MWPSVVVAFATRMQRGGSAMTPAAELDSILAKLCIFREARGESMAGKAAVLAVLRNRAYDLKNRWPKTLSGVVLQPFQFSSFNANDPNVTAWPKYGSHADWLAWLDCCTVYDAPLTADSVFGAQFYHDNFIPPPAVAWLGPGHTVADLEALKTCEIGRLSFYKLP